MINYLLCSKWAFLLLEIRCGFIFLSVFFIRWSWWNGKFPPWHSWETGRGRRRPDVQWCSVQCFWILKPKCEKVLLHVYNVTPPKHLFHPSWEGALPLNKTSDRKSICWQQWSLHSHSPMTEGNALVSSVISPDAIQCRQRLKWILSVPQVC